MKLEIDINNTLDLVSIGIPSYNASRFIIRTLESIERQSYPNIELIVIDDCSTDNTFEIVEHWAIGKPWVTAFKSAVNEGLVKTVNKLLEKCKGTYIQFADHDDILLENKIEQQVKFLNDLPTKVAMVYSNVSVIDDEDNIIEEDYLATHGYDANKMKFKDLPGELLSFNFIPGISVLLRSNCFNKVGRFDEKLRFQDLDMWLRISMSFEIAYLPEVTALYRRNENSMIHHPKNMLNINASLLDCREKYRGIKAEWDKTINKGIVNTAPYLYRYHHPSGKYWLSRRLQYDKHFKSWVYWIMSKFNSRFIWRNNRK